MPTVSRVCFHLRRERQCREMAFNAAALSRCIRRTLQSSIVKLTANAAY